MRIAETLSCGGALEADDAIVDEGQRQPTQRHGFAGGILNILVVAEGTAGDINPLLGLSSVFASKGHSVSFLANAVFADVVERCGLRFVPTGTAESYRALRDRAAGNNALQLSKLLWKSLMDSVRPVFDVLASEVDDNTVIAAHPWVLGARLVQEKHGVPMVTVHISPATLLSAKLPPLHRPFPLPLWLPYSVRLGLVWALERGVLDRILGPDINRLRYELGLPKVKRIVGRWMHSPQGVLGLFPDWFAPPQTDWPPGVSLTGFPQFDQGNLRRMDPETEEFLAQRSRPVVFTVGSTSTDERRYYAAAAAAINALGLRAIFLTNQKFPTLGPNVLVRSYVPLSRFLLGFIFAFIPTVVRQVRAASYVETAVSVHRGYLGGHRVMGLRSSSPQIVTGWFTDKVSFHFRLPNAQSTPNDTPSYRLTGASVVNYHGNPIASVTYEKESQPISLLVASSKFAIVAGGNEIRFGDLTFHYRVENGFKVITWSNHGLSYALVSTVSGSASESCLVCHQNMADHHNFRPGQ